MKNNGSPKKICDACGSHAHKLRDGLCPTCYDQSEMCAYHQTRTESSKPDGFWSKLFAFMLLFTTRGDSDRKDKRGDENAS